MTASSTRAETRTDVAKVISRVKSDLRMIAHSTKAWSDDDVNKYAHDLELLVEHGYLFQVDITLLSGNSEVKAARYTVDNVTRHLNSDRPGNVLWPNVPNSTLRLVLILSDEGRKEFHTIRSRLEINWISNNADTSHINMHTTGNSSRTYSSGDLSISRQDWAR